MLKSTVNESKQSLALTYLIARTVRKLLEIRICAILSIRLWKTWHWHTRVCAHTYSLYIYTHTHIYIYIIHHTLIQSLTISISIHALVLATNDLKNLFQHIASIQFVSTWLQIMTLTFTIYNLYALNNWIYFPNL